MWSCHIWMELCQKVYWKRIHNLHSLKIANGMQDYNDLISLVYLNGKALLGDVTQVETRQVS